MNHNHDQNQHSQQNEYGYPYVFGADLIVIAIDGELRENCQRM